MLNSIDLNDKSYEDLLAEAVAQIPLYSGEWTNFNRSDPGITILQNLSAFHLLQQSTINQVTDQVRRRLLKLVGYEARENRGAALLLQADVEEETCLPAQYKLWAGDICFETEGPVTLRPWRLDSVCTVEDGVWQDVTYLLDPSVPSAAQPFGAHPAPGRALCLLLEGKPDRSLTLWAQTPRDQVRAPFGDSGFSFAKTRWQYYTADGWADARAEDETRGFLASGAVRLELAGGEPALCPEGPGGRYALRCLLEEADYDLPPRLHTLAANLFSVVQRETRSAGYLFNGGVRVKVKSELAALGNLFVYCREVKGGPYRLYRQDPETGARGRFYRRSDHPDGVTLTFDRKAFGFAPGQGWGAVRVVCYDDELVHHRDLGPVYGYEDQVIDLDLVENVLPDGVSLIAEAPGADGELEYHFVNPGNTDPDTLCYQVESRPGRLRIVHPGLGTEYRLYLCDCAVTRGAAGNIREGGALEHRPRDPWAPKGPVFQNPAPGRGGVTFESAEDLRLRFLADVRTPATAVLASDYEDLVRRTPGLCIHKVKAVVRRAPAPALRPVPGADHGLAGAPADAHHPHRAPPAQIRAHRRGGHPAGQELLRPRPGGDRGRPPPGPGSRGRPGGLRRLGPLQRALSGPVRPALCGRGGIPAPPARGPLGGDGGGGRPPPGRPEPVLPGAVPAGAAHLWRGTVSAAANEKKGDPSWLMGSKSTNWGAAA